MTWCIRDVSRTTREEPPPAFAEVVRAHFAHKRAALRAQCERWQSEARGAERAAMRRVCARVTAALAVHSSSGEGAGASGIVDLSLSSSAAAQPRRAGAPAEAIELLDSDDEAPGSSAIGAVARAADDSGGGVVVVIDDD